MVLLRSLIFTFAYTTYTDTVVLHRKPTPFELRNPNQLVVVREVISLTFEKIWNTTFGQTAVVLHRKPTHFELQNPNQLVVVREVTSVTFENVWNTICGQTAVSFKGDYRLASPYIRVLSLRSSGTLRGVEGKVVADVSGLTTDTFFRGRRTALRLKKGSIYCLENSVTSRHNPTREILGERGPFIFWTGGAWSRFWMFLWKVSQSTMFLALYYFKLCLFV